MAPIRKHTIDRRRHARPKEDEKNDSEYSILVQAPAVANNDDSSDSSADERTPSKKAPRGVLSAKADESKTESRKNDSDLADLDFKSKSSTENDKAPVQGFLADEEEEPPPASARKKTVHSKATKRKKLTPTKQTAKPSKDARNQKEPSSDEESESGQESNVSEFEPDDVEEERVDSEESWDSEEEKPKPKRGSAKKPVVRGLRSSRRRKKASDESDAFLDSDEEEEEEMLPKKRRAKKPARAKRATRLKVDDSDESDAFLESDEEEVLPKERRTRKPTRAKRATRHKKDGSDESEASRDSDEQEEEVLPKKRRESMPARAKRANRRRKYDSDEFEASRDSQEEEARPTKGRAKKPVRSRLGRNNSDSEESWESDMEDERETKYKTPVSTRRSSRVAQLQSSDEEEHDSPRRSTPSRRSATRALTRIHDVVEKDEIVEKEERAYRSTRKRKKADEDEEFDPNAASDDPEQEVEDGLEDAEDEQEDDESSALSAVANTDDDKEYEAGNVDARQDFLTVDSSGDEATARPSPMLNVKYTPRSRRRPAKQESFDSSSESENDQIRDGHMLSSYPHMPACPSEIDAITMDPLPEKHLCFFSPDQQTRQCFALETLHKISMSSSIRGPDGKRTFLQPPHFRTPASDDFIDHIASRFGRSALDLNGDFYRRGRGDKDGYTLTFGANLANEETFLERLNDYMSNLMGSQDVYCCPLCYIASHRKLVTRFEAEEADQDEEEEVEGSSGEPIKLWHDPMTVLGFVDNEKFNLASTFCFIKVADLKRHLREAHSVDTQAVEGNDLYARFKVRASDGLLQRYIDTARQGRSFQGDMRRYWNLGNNASFVCLLYLMKRRAALKETLDAGKDESGDALLFFDNARDFYQSFENRVQNTWDTLSAPYRKASKEELKEFIEEGDVDEDDTQPHFLLQREMNEMTPEDEIAEALKQRRMSQGEEQDSEVSSDTDDHDDDDGPLEESDNDEDKSVNIPDGYYSEEEEETDEWVTSKLARLQGRGAKKAHATYSPPTKTGKRLGKARGKKNGQLKQDQDSPSDGKPLPKKKAMRTKIIIDSDSDE